MAEAVNEPREPSAARERRRRHRRGFVIAYILLATALAVAAVAFVSLLARPEPEPPPQRPLFGQFRPTAGGLDGANQIASFVGDRYRLPSGKQMVLIVAGRLEIQDTPIPAIAIQEAGGTDGDETQVLPADNTLVYSLCGSGKACAIAEGKPTAARGLVVRREALELALYTFAYLDEFDSVAAFLPPPRGQDVPRLVFFRRNDLEGALDADVRAGLIEGHAPLPGDITSVEGLAIDELVMPRLFSFTFQQLQDGRPILVLQPLASGG
jgi:hypothetical protein